MTLPLGRDGTLTSCPTRPPLPAPGSLYGALSRSRDPHVAGSTRSARVAAAASEFTPRAVRWTGWRRRPGAGPEVGDRPAMPPPSLRAARSGPFFSWPTVTERAFADGHLGTWWRARLARRREQRFVRGRQVVPCAGAGLSMAACAHLVRGALHPDHMRMPRERIRSRGGQGTDPSYELSPDSLSAPSCPGGTSPPQRSEQRTSGPHGAPRSESVAGGRPKTGLAHLGGSGSGSAGCGSAVARWFTCVGGCAWPTSCAVARRAVTNSRQEP